MVKSGSTIFDCLLFKLLVLHLLCGTMAYAQDSPQDYSFPVNHLAWYTIESEHFLVHFQEGSSRPAQVVSRVAEEVFPYITELYGVEPDTKTNIILNDREDYSNGAAYFFDNRIEIWIPSPDMPLRGTHPWIRNVVTHEFTHLVQLQAAMKRNPDLPAVYLQWMSYEGVRRPDVLYGYPSGILSYPFSSISVPGWFAEGVAQYQRTGWTFDTWDSHRDMVLRTAVLTDSYLSYEEMGTFSSKTGLERELVYNQGFAFSSWLALEFGESVFREISDALAGAGTHTMDEALLHVTGKSGGELFSEWIESRKIFYETAVRSIRPDPVSVVEGRGFLNLHPSISPDGSKLAYLSNREPTKSGVSLYIREYSGNAGTAERIDIGPAPARQPAAFSCGFSEKPLISRIRSAFSFSPNGDRLVYARRDLNALGENYNDLIIHDLKSGEKTRLTESARIHDPAWSPDGSRIAGIRMQAGTANLVLVEPTSGSVRQLTAFEDGEQLFTPTWHPDGDEIYFSFAERHGRSIKMLRLDNGTVESVLREPYIDFRDPFIDREGLFLYYSADFGGIFNIWRVPVHGAEQQQLTGLRGGAFMPELDSENNLVFAEYDGGGYRIVTKKLPRIIRQPEWGSYNRPLEKVPANLPPTGARQMNNFSDSDIDRLPPDTFTRADTGSVDIGPSTGNATETRQLYRYREVFTPFNIYPVIRFDNYSKRYGSNSSLIKAGRIGDLGGNLMRDLKLGAYFSSQEVIGSLSFYGGALFGPGSRDARGVGDFFTPARLTDLDRDLFLITEYRGLPFIKKRWSPTLTIEFYNIRRNVEEGLAVEEFPCTACLPDTTHVDIAYNIWEIDLSLSSKIDTYSLLKVGFGYTPYRIQTDGFFSREFSRFIPSTGTEYYRGTSLSAAYSYEKFNRYPHADTAPIGLGARVEYEFQPGELLDSFRIEEGTLSPVYRRSKNHSLEIDARWGFRMGEQATGLAHSRIFTYLNNPGDSFYHDYIGGFTGMRSYPYFSIGGRTTAFMQFSHIIPVLDDINRQVGRHTLDKLFLRLYAEAGNAWDGTAVFSEKLKTGLGAELRFSLNSYYLYPLKFFLSGSYGFNKFDVNLPPEFITESASSRVSYGRELLIHFGLTFDFEVFNHD